MDRLEVIDMTNQDSDLVPWEPEFSPEAFAHMERLRKQIEPRIALMREMRKQLKLTQREVAEALGVTQSNVSKIEASGDPSLSVLARMADAGGKRLKLTLEAADGTEEASFELS
jgi:DNA-binding XRE family transcriptional regulator